jgi:hypothetical protein
VFAITEIKTIVAMILCALMILQRSSASVRASFRLTVYPMCLSKLLKVLKLQVTVREMSACARLFHMQVETQIQPVTGPENALQVESTESKAKRGGKRTGAGRKPNPAKIVLKGTSRTTLLQALENVDPQLVAAKITKLLQSKREIIWLQTLNFIYDRMLGKPKQDVSVSGAFIHAEVRDPVLLGWPKEALTKLAGRYDEAYREVVREFGLDVAQNGPHNQIESKAAIEAEVVDVGARNGDGCAAGRDSQTA